MADQEIPEKYRVFSYFMDRYGVTLATAIFLGWVLVHQLKDIKKQLDRCVNNERSIMTKLGIKYELEK